MEQFEQAAILRDEVREGWRSGLLLRKERME